MKKAILMSAILCFGTATAAIAEPIDVSTETKQSGVVLGSFITGALAGMAAGGWLSEEVKEADKLESVEDRLAQANSRVEQLSQQLVQAELSTQQFAQIALDQLQLELLFRTGDSQLTPSGEKRVAYLAGFLLNNPDLNIRLDGYADPEKWQITT
jgi:outer membrane protein OmpA-like peptidoglycan-associated protein